MQTFLDTQRQDTRRSKSDGVSCWGVNSLLHIATGRNGSVVFHKSTKRGASLAIPLSTGFIEGASKKSKKTTLLQPKYVPAFLAARLTRNEASLVLKKQRAQARSGLGARGYLRR